MNSFMVQFTLQLILEKTGKWVTQQYLGNRSISTFHNVLNFNLAV